MKSNQYLAKTVLVASAFLLLPALAAAQGSIAGTVIDTSGGALPGVTVLASSPALLEPRTIVTDGAGLFQIVDLRPGIYTVTFTLPGFATVLREGLELSGTLTAVTDITMPIGGLEETITVTGETPLVDVRGTRQEAVLDAELLAAIPTGRSHYHLATLIPGMQTGVRDVGGAGGVQVSGSGAIHGASNGRLLADGLTVGHNGESLNMWLSNVGGAQETVIQTSGGLGEAETGGVQINIVPREGGNLFSGSTFFSFANSSMAGSNFTPELKAAGLRTPNELDRVYDFNPTFGGPLLQDRLWFFLTSRAVGAYNFIPIFPNLNAGDINSWEYVPDTSRRAITQNRYITASARVTWQVTARHKFNVFWDEQQRAVDFDTHGGSATTSPEADAASGYTPNRVTQATWQSPVTNQILLEAGYGAYMQRWGSRPRMDGTFDPLSVRVQDQGGIIPGLRFKQPGNYGHNWTGIQSWRASMTYVTGSHTVKLGYTGAHHAPAQNEFTNPSGFQQFRLRNGVPNRIDLYTNRSYAGILDMTAFYAQDQWTLGRLTLQGALRFDNARGSFSGGDRAELPTIFAGPFIAEDITFSGEDLRGVRWTDITPRMGVSYDLLGNGRTAVKVTLGKYMESIGAVPGGSTSPTAGALNPITRASRNVRRSWVDADGDFFPDCDLRNNAANGECGRVSDLNFGTKTFSSTPDRDRFEGWNKRDFNWEFGANIEHELVSGLSVDLGYFRRWFGNFTVTDNLAVGPEDFDEFSVVAPTDARLPGGGGQTITGLFNVSETKFGQVDNFITAASNYGKQVRRWHGVDLNVNGRFEALQIQGGFSTGTELRDNCEIRVALPEIAATNPYCRTETPWLTQVKGLAAYTIPVIDVQVSGTFQNTPGAIVNSSGQVSSLSANFVIPNAAVAPSLGRNLSGGSRNVVVNLTAPGEVYGDRTNQIDFRVAKIFRYAGTRAQIGLDIYNLTNNNTAQTYQQTFGSSWLNPTSILQPRFVKISMQFDF